MTETGRIREHIPVVGSDGGHVGTVDRVEHGEIRLTREDDPARNHGHRRLPLRLVASAEAGQVRLTVPAHEALAVAFGALRPGDEVAGAGPGPDEGGGTAVSDMVGQGGGGSGNLHGGGSSPHRGTGPGGDNLLHGGGTGGGGTSRHGHLGSGGGIPGDPNMDPRGGRDPKP
jgi:hypothetical protein